MLCLSLYFFPIHSASYQFSCLAFSVMNLNYAKVTFHSGDLSSILLELHTIMAMLIDSNFPY